MKKMALGLMLTLVALGLTASSAMAAPDSPRIVSDADQAFLATLAPSPQPTAPLPVAAHPLGGKALCTASANCGSGSPISCSGSSSCSNVDQNCSAGQRGYVLCDGVKTSCPNACPCTLDCAAERHNCDIDCGTCPFIFSCSTSTCTFSCQCRVTGTCML